MKRSYDPALIAAPIVTGEGRGLREHRVQRSAGLPWWMLHYTVTGRSWWKPSNRAAFDSLAGELVLVAPQVPQDYGVGKGDLWSPLWFIFESHPGLERWLHGWPAVGRGHYRLRLDPTDTDHLPKIVSLMQEAHQIANSGSPNCRWLAMNRLEAALIWIDSANPLSTASRLDPRVRRAADHIHRHINNTLSLDRLAEIADVSVPQLGRLFRSAFDQSVMQYVEAARMKRAKELLQLSPLSIRSISWEVGFSSPYYFSRRFQMHTGLSPSEYRRRF